MLPDCSCASCGYAQTSTPRGSFSPTSTPRPIGKSKLLLLVWIGLFAVGMFAISYSRSGQQLASGAAPATPQQITPLR